MSQKKYFLALNRIPKMGARTLIRCLKQWPDVREMFQLSVESLELAGLSPLLANHIVNFNWREIEEDIHWQEQASQTILTWEDAEYPYLLKEIYDPPIVLYAKGDIACLNQPLLAMVGTRNPSIHGSETAWRFARELAEHHITIVSGLALGVDAEAHKGCLAAQGRTIAVMGTGVNRIYPRQHAKLAEKIPERGLLLSEFPLNTPPASGHFPQRNRIISGLSLSTLVIEAALKSGSLITARFALEQNRDVLAVPGSIRNPQSRGCHYLLQQGAKLVTSSRDVFDSLNLSCSEYAERNTSLEGLASGNKNLVKFIGFEITTVDQILGRSGLSFEQVTCDLAELELQGVVTAVPGGYMRCK